MSVISGFLWNPLQDTVTLSAGLTNGLAILITRICLVIVKSSLQTENPRYSHAQNISLAQHSFQQLSDCVVLLTDSAKVHKE